MGGRVTTTTTTDEPYPKDLVQMDKIKYFTEAVVNE